MNDRKSSGCKKWFVPSATEQKQSRGSLSRGVWPVRRVETYKILGVHLSSDLTWNVHIEYIVKKASKRLYALRSLKKAGVHPSDLVGIYCALIRSVLEYAAPVWSGLLVYLSEVLEAVQRRAMRIIFPNADYNTALCSAGLGSLADRRDAICAKFISKARTSPPLSYILTNRCTIDHGYQLRSGQQRYEQVKATRRDLTILLLYVFSKVYMTHHCNSGVLSCKSGV